MTLKSIVFAASLAACGAALSGCMSDGGSYSADAYSHRQGSSNGPQGIYTGSGNQGGGRQ